MTNLGIINGWATKPIEYTKHLAECGTEYTGTWCETVNGVITHTPKTYRRYDMAVKRLGTCYRQETCNDCGCSWEVDSGG
jgi:hypothetical protein